MPNKQDLAAMLGGKSGAPEIRRGRGVTLSTELTVAEPPAPVSASVQPEATALQGAATSPEAPPILEPVLPAEPPAPEVSPPVLAVAPSAVTSQPAAEPPALPAAPPVRKKREPVTSRASRLNRGFAVRADLARAFKLIAAFDDRPIYDVMEEAMQQYVDAWRAAHPNIRGW